MRKAQHRLVAKKRTHARTTSASSVAAIVKEMRQTRVSVDLLAKTIRITTAERSHVGNRSDHPLASVLQELPALRRSVDGLTREVLGATLHARRVA